MKQETITIKAKPWAKSIVEAGGDENEVCGMMIGKDGIVEDIVMMKSEYPSPVRFEVSAMKAGEIIYEAMQKGLKVIGVFHSHPLNHPQPSMTDHDYMEAHPYVWTIYSPRHKTWASWRRVDDEIVPVLTEIDYN